MRAVVLEAPNSFQLTEVSDPAPSATEVVIRVGATGICGTDLHIVDGEFPPTPYPIIPGHEFAGEIVAVGTGVDFLSEGTRVAVDPSLFCGYCPACQRQRGNLCSHWGAVGDTVNGAFAEYVAVPARNAHTIPDSVSFNEAALVEPLACAVHGLNRLRVTAGASLLVVGAGTMGLLLAQLARRTGAAMLTVVDTDQSRRALAEKLGFTTAASIPDALAELPSGYDFVVEATGVPAAGQEAIQAIARGGTFMVFGVAPAQATLEISPFSIYNDEITIVGSMAVLNTFPAALRMLASGAIDADIMVSHTFGLGDFSNALQTVRERTGLKVQIMPDH
jgi:2-desacetyl-2-hydroxyethyl bacteriochlorophyllide A dehydrogenase